MPSLRFIVALAASVALLGTSAFAQGTSTRSTSGSDAAASGNYLVQTAAPAPKEVTLHTTVPAAAPSLNGGANNCAESVSGGGSFAPVSLVFGASYAGKGCEDRQWYAAFMNSARAAHEMGQAPEQMRYLRAANSIACTNDELKGRLPPEFCNLGPAAPTQVVALSDPMRLLQAPETVRIHPLSRKTTQLAANDPRLRN